MDHTFSFDSVQFSRLFPFYLLINSELETVAWGKSLNKLLDLEAGMPFSKLFSIPRPNTPVEKFNDLVELGNSLVVLESFTPGRILLRGQFEYLPDTREILFVGSPWFGSMDQVKENNLVIDDFARHDPLIDLLHVLKSQEITNDDLKQLISTISKQKADLKKANKEVHDIALFPRQNPDPLIRINFDGDILTNNPAAALLDFFEFENHRYRNDDFFKLIATRIDFGNPKQVFEARSEGRDYSFVCVPMPQERYINFYGRDITQQKKDRQQLERLSLVASANENGVLFTGPDGIITWVNQGFCKLSGYSLTEVIGKTPIELFRGLNTDESTLLRVTESFLKGEGFSEEVVYYRKDGSWFWGRSVGQPIRNKDGKVTEYFGIVQDVTEEKANEEKIRVLSKIAEDNLNAVVITDKDGRITWVNKSFSKITGYALEESLGKKPGHLLQGPETDQATATYLRKQVQNGEPFSAEIVNYSKSGEKYWLRVLGQPIKNERGEVTGFFALEEDITNEKDREDRFKRALEKIGDNVWEHDFGSGKTYFSKSENEFLGYLPEALTSNQELWWNSVLAEDRHLLVKNDEKYKAGQLDSHSLEYRIKDSSGNIRWVLDRGVVIEKDRTGRPLRITGTHTDITARKEFEQVLKANEEKYRLIISNMNLGLMEIGTDLKIKFANHTLLNMLGSASRDIIGEDVLDLVSPEVVGVLKEKMANREGGVSEAYEIKSTFNKKEGWWFVSSAPNYDSAGTYVGSIISMLDITKQKKLELELIQAREQAEQLAVVKERFLANMSHEIRTPMNAIIGMGSQLARTSLTGKQTVFLSAMNTAAENLLVIINDILDLSKIEAGKLSIENIAFEPGKVINNAVQILMHKAQEKGLRLDISLYDRRISPWLMGDPYRLNQVLLNLMSNAIKFTQEGSVDIACGVLGETDNTQTIGISVTDTGIGMDEEFAKRLFDKFSQEYESTSRRYGGSGLGMSICKELIELMGGQIDVKTIKGEGTVVSFRITFEKGSALESEGEDEVRISGDFLKGRTILVVDDSDMNRLVASTILENYGASIMEASNGEEALDALEKRKTDLVLMDIQMPVMNGYEAVRQIRKQGSTIPIIALTANAIKGEHKKCVDAGMNDYISKPFKELEFLKKVAHWVEAPVALALPEVIKSHPGESRLYDLSTLKEIGRGNEEFLRKMIRLFCDQAPAMVQQMKEAYGMDRLDKVGALAHKLKASIDSLKIHSLTRVIRDIEAGGKGLSKTEELSSLLRVTDETVHSVVRSLLQEYPD